MYIKKSFCKKKKFRIYKSFDSFFIEGMEWVWVENEILIPKKISLDLTNYVHLWDYIFWRLYATLQQI